MFLGVETTFRHTFPFSDLQCLPPDDPKVLCANMGIRLLATHSFKTKVQKPYPLYDQNGQNRYPIYDQRPFRTAYVYGAHIMEYAPPTRRLLNRRLSYINSFASPRIQPPLIRSRYCVRNAKRESLFAFRT